MKPIIAIGTMLMGVCAMVCAIGAHSFEPPKLKGVEVLGVESSTETATIELPRMIIAATPNKRKSSPQVKRSNRCWIHELEQQGRPGANTVKVCE